MSANCSADSPEVLVSIKPLHSIISHITEGVSETKLLLENQQSPHHFQLRPSQKRLINQADIFFYSNNKLEAFVDNLKNSSDKLQFIELSNLKEINALPVRSFHAHDHTEVNHDTDGHNIDGHIWLSINNAQQIARYVTQTLSALDPDNTARYRSNLNALLIKLDDLKQRNKELFSELKKQPFLVYHDAFQYFEVENGLMGAHFVTTTPEHTPGIKRIRELRKIIKTEAIQCVFYEPPNIPSLLKTLKEGASIQLAAIDPAGAQIKAGKQHYFTLMQTTASILSTCLSKHQE